MEVIFFMATRMTKPIKCEPIIVPQDFKEEWKDIKGYEGLYKISNCGRVYSLRQNKLLTLHRSQSDYVYIGLHKECKVRNFRVHRLVAEHFIPNLNNLTEVNHIDEDKDNNCVTNLEWVSHKDNCNHGTRNRRCAEGSSRPVVCVETGLIYPSGKFADMMFGYKQGRIASCLSPKSRAKTAYGFHWEYVVKEVMQDVQLQNLY